MNPEIIVKYVGKKPLKTKNIFERWFFGNKIFFSIQKEIQVELSNGDNITIPEGFLNN